MAYPQDKQREACVYWIRTPDHSDILKEGYVGFTSSGFRKRMLEHYAAASSGVQYPVYRAIRKYGESGLIASVVCVGNLEYCLDLERKLRPEIGIGWNLAIGGGVAALGRKLTDAQKMAVSIAQKGRVRTEQERINIGNAARGRRPSDATRKLLSEKAKAKIFSESHKKNISKAKKGIPSTNPAWLHPAADKKKWILCREYFDLYNHGFGRVPSSEMLGFDKDAFKPIVLRIRNGWNPYEDEKYLEWVASMKQEDL